VCGKAAQEQIGKHEAEERVNQSRETTDGERGGEDAFGVKGSRDGKRGQTSYREREKEYESNAEQERKTKRGEEEKKKQL